MIAFIDDHRAAYGVEPICRVLPTAPSTYHAHVASRVDPALLPERAKRDDVLKPKIQRVFDENFRALTSRNPSMEPPSLPARTRPRLLTVNRHGKRTPLSG
jgi:hypothetical protein